MIDNLRDMHICPTGFTFCVCGEENSGKTSVMHYACGTIGQKALDLLKSKSRKSTIILSLNEKFDDNELIIAVDPRSFVYTGRELYSLINSITASILWESCGQPLTNLKELHTLVMKELTRRFKCSDSIEDADIFTLLCEQESEIVKLCQKLLGSSGYVYHLVKRKCVENKITARETIIEAMCLELEKCWSTIESQELFNNLKRLVQDKVTDLFNSFAKSKEGYNCFVINDSAELMKLRKIACYYNEIIIHAPFNKDLLQKLIKKQKIGMYVPINEEGFISFVMIEHESLHFAGNNINNEKVFNAQLYDSRLDALILVRNIGVSNLNVELDHIYCKALSKFSRTNPVFIVNNKFDIAALEGSQIIEGLSTLTTNLDEYYRSCNSEILEGVNTYYDNLMHLINSRKGKVGILKSYACVSQMSAIINPEYYKSIADTKLSLSDLYDNIFDNIAIFNSSKSNRVVVRAVNEHDNFSINLTQLCYIFRQALLKQNSINVLQKCLQNVYEHLSLDMQSLPDIKDIYQFEQSLRLGSYYISSDHSNLWYYFPVEIRFPEYIVGLLTDELIINLCDAIECNMCIPDKDSKTIFITNLKKYVRKKDFVKALLFDELLFDAKENCKGYYTCFLTFIKNSETLFSDTAEPSVIEKYARAAMYMLEKAIRKFINEEISFSTSKDFKEISASSNSTIIKTDNITKNTNMSIF